MYTYTVKTTSKYFIFHLTDLGSFSFKRLYTDLVCFHDDLSSPLTML